MDVTVCLVRVREPELPYGGITHELEDVEGPPRWVVTEVVGERNGDVLPRDVRPRRIIAPTLVDVVDLGAQSLSQLAFETHDVLVRVGTLVVRVHSDVG